MYLFFYCPESTANQFQWVTLIFSIIREGIKYIFYPHKSLSYSPQLQTIFFINLNTLSYAFPIGTVFSHREGAPTFGSFCLLFSMSFPGLQCCFVFLYGVTRTAHLQSYVIASWACIELSNTGSLIFNPISWNSPFFLFFCSTLSQYFHQGIHHNPVVILLPLQTPSVSSIRKVVHVSGLP